MVRRLALQGLTRAFRAGAMGRLPTTHLLGLGASATWGPWTRPLQDLVASAIRGKGKLAPRELSALCALTTAGATTAMGLSMWG